MLEHNENEAYGHVAISCDDVYRICSRMEEAGVRFCKKTLEGHMKGIAIIFDPDG